MIPNASCPKCNETEPQDWDFKTEGLWICCCKSKPKISIDKVLQVVIKRLKKEGKI